MSGEEAFFNLIKSLGVPTALSIAIVFSIWRALGWFADNILKPLTDRQLKFMDDLEASYQKQSADNILKPLTDRQLKFMDDLEASYQKQSVAIEAVARAVEAIRVSVATQEHTLQRLLNNADRESK